MILKQYLESIIRSRYIKGKRRKVLFVAYSVKFQQMIVSPTQMALNNKLQPAGGLLIHTVFGGRGRITEHDDLWSDKL